MPKESQGPRLRKDRATGFYKIVWTETVDGAAVTRRRSTRTKDPKFAQEIFGRFLIGKDEQPAPDGITVSEMLDFYQAEVIDKKGRTGNGFRFSRNNLVAYFGDRAVNDLRQADFEGSKKNRVIGYIPSRRKGAIGRRASDGTIRRELIGVFTAAVNYCLKRKKLEPGDVPYFDVPPPPPPRSRTLTDDELAAIMKKVPEFEDGRLSRLYRYMAFMIYAPARKGAVEGLTWFQVDFAKNRIDFRPKGRKETNKRFPVISIPPEMRPTLERAFEERASEYVLDHPSNMADALTRACRAAGVDGVTSHTFRHDWATRAVEAGVSFEKVAMMLGNTAAIVEKNYAHCRPDFMEDVVDHAMTRRGILRP